jgi:VCBS repeat protein
MFRLFRCFASFLISVIALAQSTPPPSPASSALPTDPETFLGPVAKVNGLGVSCLPPWHVKASFVSAHAGAKSALLVHAGLANASLIGFADFPEEPPALIAVGDFNRDGITDYVQATRPDGEDSGPYSLTIFLGKADGTFLRAASPHLIGRDPRALVVGDFNGDGISDAIVGDGDGTLLEFLGDGKGNLVPAGRIATLGSVVSIAVGHFTHDGHLDLAVSDFNSNTAAILLGAGDGSFRQAWSFQLPQSGREFHLATADFNKDGVADLAITSEDDGNYEVMLGNGNGTFTYSPKLSHLKDPNSYCPT